MMPSKSPLARNTTFAADLMATHAGAQLPSRPSPYVGASKSSICSWVGYTLWLTLGGIRRSVGVCIIWNIYWHAGAHIL